MCYQHLKLDYKCQNCDFCDNGMKSIKETKQLNSHEITYCYKFVPAKLNKKKEMTSTNSKWKMTLEMQNGR